MIFVVLFQECIIGQHLKERDISKTLKIFSFHWKKNNKMVTWLIAYKTYKKENYEYYGIAFMLERHIKKPLKDLIFEQINTEIFSTSIRRILIRPLVYHLFNIGNKSQLGKNKSKTRKTKTKKRKTRKSYCTWREEIKFDYSEMHYLFT